MSRSFGPEATRFAERYPLSAFPDPTRALSRIYTDDDWICPTLRTNRDYARTAPTWSYLFADPEAPTLFGEQVPRPAATHGSDVAYTLPTAGSPTFLSPRQRRLGDQMTDYWAAFARTGNPNGPGLPGWPATTPAAAPAMTLTSEPGPHPVDTTARCS